MTDDTSFYLYLALDVQDNITDSKNINTLRREKGKRVPLQPWSGPKGFRNLRFPNFMTTAQNVGKVFSLTHWPRLPQGNTPGTHFC